MNLEGLVICNIFFKKKIDFSFLRRIFRPKISMNSGTLDYFEIILNNPYLYEK